MRRGNPPPPRKKILNRNENEADVNSVKKALGQKKAPKREPLKGGQNRFQNLIHVQTLRHDQAVDVCSDPSVAKSIFIIPPYVVLTVSAPFLCAGAVSRIFTRFSKRAFTTTTRVEPDIDRAATSGLNNKPTEG